MNCGIPRADKNIEKELEKKRMKCLTFKSPILDFSHSKVDTTMSGDGQYSCSLLKKIRDMHACNCIQIFSDKETGTTWVSRR